MTSEPSSTQSTDPKSQWPTPAIKVSGTAWAMSEPTSRAIGVRGVQPARIVDQSSQHLAGSAAQRPLCTTWTQAASSQPQGKEVVRIRSATPIKMGQNSTGVDTVA